MQVKITISDKDGVVLDMQDVNVTKQYLIMYELESDKTFKTTDEIAEFNIGAIPKGVVHFRDCVYLQGQKQWYKTRSICGRSWVKYPNLRYSPNMILTRHTKEVTCKNCLTRLSEGEPC